MNISGITVTCELRPCFIDDRKALFHKWTEEAEVNLATGLPLKTTFGIVEFEDGQVHTVKPYKIKFCDYKIKEYYFGEDEVEKTEGVKMNEEDLNDWLYAL